MDDAGVQPLQLGEIEAGRGAAEGGEVEAGDQRRGLGQRLDRQAGADPGELGQQGLGLDAGLAQRLDAERAEPFGELALRAGEQRLVREGRGGGAQAPRTSAAAGRYW